MSWEQLVVYAVVAIAGYAARHVNLLGLGSGAAPTPQAPAQPTPILDAVEAKIEAALLRRFGPPAQPSTAIAPPKS